MIDKFYSKVHRYKETSRKYKQTSRKYKQKKYKQKKHKQKKHKQKIKEKNIGTVRLSSRSELPLSLPSGLTIAELGVFEGNFSRELLKSNPSRLYLVDIFSGTALSGDDGDGNNIHFCDMGKSYKRLKAEMPTNVTVVRSKSHDWLRSLPDNFLDMVYIDNDHSYGACYGDLELSMFKVKHGGIIAGHDYNNIHDVHCAVNDYCKNYSQSISKLYLDNCESFAIINKKKKDKKKKDKNGRIPRIIHFVWIGPNFSYMDYIAIKSAIKFNPSYKIYMV